jgi:hypothetical protein
MAMPFVLSAARARPTTPPGSGDGTTMLARSLRSPTARAAFVVVMVVGVLWIAGTSVEYLDDGALHPFVREKGRAGRAFGFRVALAVHIVAAVTTLPACLLLLSRRVLRAVPRMHRLLGRLTGVVVLLALVPSGFVLSTTARGGVAGTAGFVASGLLLAGAMVAAIARARRGDTTGHRRATAQVLAQMSVAVTSRVLLLAAEEIDAALEAGWSPDVVYVAALWLPVLGSAALAAFVAPARPADVHSPNNATQGGFRAAFSARHLRLRPAR